MMRLDSENLDNQGRPCLPPYKSFNQESVLIIFAFEISPFGSNRLERVRLKAGTPVRKQLKELK